MWKASVENGYTTSIGNFVDKNIAPQEKTITAKICIIPTKA